MESHQNHHHHHHHQKQGREKSVDNHQEHQKSPPQSSSSSSSSSKQQVTISPASPPSASSSPSHEFSFTISLHSSNTLTNMTKNDNKINTTKTDGRKSKTPPPSLAIDLSPADDIFFHGHLLPLHLLSHLPVSPRSSTNSLEQSSALPIKDISSSNDTQKPTKDNHSKNSTSSSSSSSYSSSSTTTTTTTTATTTTTSSSQKSEATTKGLSRNKPKSSSSSSFSLFGLGKWRRGYEFRKREDNSNSNSKEKPKRKLRFEVSQALKRYMRMVRPLLFFGGRRENSNSFQLRRQPYSFSGVLSSRSNSNKDLRGGSGRREYSAPASIRTSPSNSGLLVATASATATLPSSVSDSTMEELQAAIQAAIAHCKNSIASHEDHKLKC